MNLKDNNTINTMTYNRDDIEAPTGNIYQSVSIIAKRAEQINSKIRSELLEKLEEFETFNENLEEFFENKEQIEVSKFYEKLPKPQTLATEEWLKNQIYFRDPEVETT